MHISFSDSAIEIVNENFNKEGFSYPKTVIVRLFNEKNEVVFQENFGYIDETFLKEYYKKNNELHLDYAYIENFNLNFLKQKKQSDKLILTNFSCSNAIIYSKTGEIDFSNIAFDGLTVTFKNTRFISKSVNFSNTSFNSQLTDFSNTFFESEFVNFSKTRFFEGDLNFKNAVFSDGNKDFQDIKFPKGKVTFINVDFNNGDVLFTDSKFISGIKSFKVSNFGKGKVDFTRVKFGKDETSFEKTNFGDGDISFRSASFQNGKVNFTSSEFGYGKKSFINTEFGNGNVYFKNASFGDGQVSFRLSTFGKGIADFHFSEFGNAAIQFDRAKFISGGIDFKAVNFGTGKVSFNKTYMGKGDINLEGSTLVGEFLMKDSVFGNGEFNFKEADFSEANVEIQNVDFGIGKISFSKSSFKKLSLKESQLDNYFDLQIASCEMLDLSNTVVKGILDINPPDFFPVVKAIDLSGMRLLGRIYIDWRRIELKKLIYNQNKIYKSKEEQFRILKENYNQTGQYSYEDEAYVEFKRTEAKAHLKEDIIKKPNLKLWAYLNYLFKWLIFDKMGKYATDPLRVLSTMLITYLFFTLIYLILGEFGDTHIISSLFEPNDPRVLGSFGKAFYHSAITFLTIGYGDYYPDGISRWISSIEGFVGLFLMSYFTVAFVRKILR